MSHCGARVKNFKKVCLDFTSLQIMVISTLLYDTKIHVGIGKQQTTTVPNNVYNKDQ